MCITALISARLAAMAGHSILRQFATGRTDDEDKAELIEMAGNDDCSGCGLCAKECPAGRKGNHLYL
ncbi:MAG: 4Fe-4S dicluster domain-containing protein [Bacteroidales bacterium]|nr:4Fe-4S dicluster domain-containing protein [Bacteroidales bacterium]